jgi:hypothetical protein
MVRIFGSLRRDDSHALGFVRRKSDGCYTGDA